MYGTQLALQQFRNYQTVQIALAPGLNIFWGDNGQGKTNLLEAVHVCCLGKSHRTAQTVEMVRYGQQDAKILLSVQRSDGPRNIHVMLQATRQKRISVSGVPIRRMSELMGHAQCVLFAPDDLQMVKGGPSKRRRYMDTALCQISPRYFTALSKYNLAVSQRNALLKKGVQDAALYQAYESTMAAYGAELLTERQAFCQRIAALAQTVYQEIAPGEELLVQYHPSVYKEQAEEKDALLAGWEKTRAQDMRRGMTGFGPHRDDLALAIGGKEARSYASQGQQRTAVLALKLAEVEKMEETSGHRPMLLLDDVLSELDQKRQEALFAHIAGQALLTMAAPPGKRFQHAKVFEVKQGALLA